MLFLPLPLLIILLPLALGKDGELMDALGYMNKKFAF